jgi:hypothetical protein
MNADECDDVEEERGGIKYQPKASADDLQP